MMTQLFDGKEDQPSASANAASPKVLLSKYTGGPGNPAQGWYQAICSTDPKTRIIFQGRAQANSFAKRFETDVLVQQDIVKAALAEDLEVEIIVRRMGSGFVVCLRLPSGLFIVYRDGRRISDHAALREAVALVTTTIVNETRKETPAEQMTTPTGNDPFKR